MVSHLISHLSPSVPYIRINIPAANSQQLQFRPLTLRVLHKSSNFHSFITCDRVKVRIHTDLELSVKTSDDEDNSTTINEGQLIWSL